MRNQSPFSKIKFENDGRHLYFIKEDDLQALEGDTPLIIHGPRGTGKTTLLNSLNWKEHKSNINLMSVLERIGSRRDYIGIYLKVPELKVKGLKGWEDGDQEIYSHIFSYYIELVWLEELIIAIAEMAIGGDLSFSPKDEKNFMERIISGRIKFVPKNIKARTLYDLADEFGSRRRNIENASLYNENIMDLYESLGDVGQVGSLGKNICKELSGLVGNSPGGNPYKFKICMDECECLSLKQSQVMNTLIRLSAFPVFYVFSFVRLPDIRSTLIDNISNQKADVSIIDLDRMTNERFKELSEGVATVRIRSVLGDECSDFSMKKLFGEISINKILSSLLSSSVSEKARALLDRAKMNKNHPFFEPYKEDILPIYQTYLVDRLKINIDDGLEEGWKRRGQDSKEIRKRMVVAYLSICKELNMEVMYAFTEMILEICDKSIRDFLSQMDEIYKVMAVDLSKFMSSLIEMSLQSKGILIASNQKLKSIPSSKVSSPGPIALLVYGLSSLTRIIQTSSNDTSHLRSSERGIFVVNYTGNTEDDLLIRFIIEAAEAGFLKIIEHGKGVMKFRIHTSLSPAFGTSYRGAYYDTPLKLRHLQEILSAEDRDSLDKKVERIASDIYDIGESPQLTIRDF